MGAHRLLAILALSVTLAGCCLEITSTGSTATTTGRQPSTSSGAAAGSTSGGTTSGTGTTGGDLCAKVQCPGPLDCVEPVSTAQICDPADGQCKCYLGGPACGYGYCDLDGGCDIFEPEGPCPDPCPPNTLLDFANGECHCGDLDGPICTGNSCHLFPPDSGLSGGECGSNEPCNGVICPTFEACDPNNVDSATGIGRCECGGNPEGGVPGVVCSFRETCIVATDGGVAACRQICQPFGGACPPVLLPDASVPVPQGCYFFSEGAACAPASGEAGFGEICHDATDCAPPLTCGVEALNAGKPEPGCVSYCDVFAAGDPTSMPAPDGGTHACAPGSICVPLPWGIVAGTCEPE